MARGTLRQALNKFRKKIDTAEDLYSVALQFYNAGNIKGLPRFKKEFFEMLVELCFLRAFLAWEEFLEDSFLLYLRGKKSPKGFFPKRHATPITIKHARELATGEDRFPDWTASDKVTKRATKFFKNGEPYTSALIPITAQLEDIKIIRNSIAHASIDSRERFKSLVRRRIRGGSFPAGLTVGGFLNTFETVTPTPTSFLEYYIQKLHSASADIVPS